MQRQLTNNHRNRNMEENNDHEQGEQPLQCKQMKAFQRAEEIKTESLLNEIAQLRRILHEKEARIEVLEKDVSIFQRKVAASNKSDESFWNICDEESAAVHLPLPSSSSLSRSIVCRNDAAKFAELKRENEKYKKLYEQAKASLKCEHDGFNDAVKNIGINHRQNLNKLANELNIATAKLTQMQIETRTKEMKQELEKVTYACEMEVIKNQNKKLEEKLQQLRSKVASLTEENEKLQIELNFCNCKASTLADEKSRMESDVQFLKEKLNESYVIKEALQQNFHVALSYIQSKAAEEKNAKAQTIARLTAKNGMWREICYEILQELKTSKLHLSEFYDAVQQEKQELAIYEKEFERLQIAYNPSVPFKDYETLQKSFDDLNEKHIIFTEILDQQNHKNDLTILNLTCNEIDSFEAKLTEFHTLLNLQSAQLRQ